MRQTILLLLVISILLPVIQCGNKDNIQSLNGKTELLSLLDIDMYPMPIKHSKKLPIPNTTDTLVPVFDITIDTLRWIYEFPPGDSSSLCIIINGWINVDNSSYKIVGDSTDPIPEEQWPFVNEMVSGKTFLGVENWVNDTAGIVFIIGETVVIPDTSATGDVSYDTLYLLHDTIPVVNSLQSELIFIENSTLFVGFDGEVLKTIPLENPW